MSAVSTRGEWLEDDGARKPRCVVERGEFANK